MNRHDEIYSIVVVVQSNFPPKNLPCESEQVKGTTPLNLNICRKILIDGLHARSRNSAEDMVGTRYYVFSVINKATK